MESVTDVQQNSDQGGRSSQWFFCHGPDLNKCSAVRLQVVKKDALNNAQVDVTFIKLHKAPAA